MKKIIEGRVLKLGDDIDTDSILPGRYLTLSDADDLVSFSSFPKYVIFLSAVNKFC